MIRIINCSKLGPPTIHEHGGDVLKLIGDGTLAIFAAQDRAHACDAALSAAIAARRRVAETKKRRAAENKPVTDMYLGLHVGKVFYGNVGSRERLDFTVIGPAVNEASRIAAMCRRSISRSWCRRPSPQSAT
jgi:adenylate cyclase